MTLAMVAVAQRTARRYHPRPSVATTTAIALATCAIALGLCAALGRSLTWSAAAMLACAATCAATDLQSGYVFDRVFLAALAAIVPATMLAGTIRDGLLGAAVCGGALLLPYVVTRGRAIGLGDVKFAGTAGLALGLGASLAALWYGCVCGGGVAAVALATGRARRGMRVPFGPFLALGVCAALLQGSAR
jgi:leader peptidase (prepilin peptidase)/N-methyltransferase